MTGIDLSFATQVTLQFYYKEFFIIKKYMCTYYATRPFGKSQDMDIIYVQIENYRKNLTKNDNHNFSEM